MGRLGTAAAWLSFICCLPYLVLKVVWTLDIPWGISDRSLFDTSGWAASNGLMAVVQVVGLLLVLALIRPGARRLPGWFFLCPAWVGTGLLFQVVVGALLVGLFSPPSASSGSIDGIQPWVFIVVYAGFAGQGIALAIAFASYVRARWGRLLAVRTGDVLARAARVQPWPGDHLSSIAEVIAGMAFAVALMFSYWAAGGSFGLSGGETDPTGMQASRVIGALVVVVGLLALAGRWGHDNPLWLPAAIIWLGSGSLVAFDGFVLATNRLFLLFGADLGPDGSESSLALIDLALLVKAVIGVLAAALGGLAVIAAVRADSNLTRT